MTAHPGGAPVNSCLVLAGDVACKTAETFNADIAFFSCGGVSEDVFLTDIAREENIVRKSMIQNFGKAYLLCVTKKFDKKYYHNLCRKDAITGIVHE